MKALAAATTALALIGLFWACVLIIVITGQAQAVLGTVAEAQVNIDWLDWTKAATGVWTAIIATFALQNWRRQAHAKSKVDFLDLLTDAVHAYIEELSGPIEMTRYVQIAVDSFSEDGATGGARIDGAIAYIRSHGDEDGKRFFGYLERCNPHLAKIRSLVAKGQVLGFSDYQLCQSTCGSLISYHEKMLGLCSIIGQTSTNWTHPRIRNLLERVLEINAVEIKKGVELQSAAYLTFVKHCYAQVYR